MFWNEDILWILNRSWKVVFYYGLNRNLALIEGEHIFSLESATTRHVCLIKFENIGCEYFIEIIK